MARKRTMTDQLPPTPCTAEMRTRMLRIAEVNQISIAELTRSAIAFYFLTFDRNTVFDEDKSLKEEGVAS